MKVGLTFTLTTIKKQVRNYFMKLTVNHLKLICIHVFRTATENTRKAFWELPKHSYFETRLFRDKEGKIDVYAINNKKQERHYSMKLTVNYLRLICIHVCTIATENTGKDFRELVKYSYFKTRLFRGNEGKFDVRANNNNKQVCNSGGFRIFITLVKLLNFFCRGKHKTRTILHLMVPNQPGIVNTSK